MTIDKLEMSVKLYIQAALLAACGLRLGTVVVPLRQTLVCNWRHLAVNFVDE